MVFESFRRYQKQALVGLTVLAMFAFVLAQFIEGMTRTGGGGGDPVVATMWGEKIRASQVGKMQADRSMANMFCVRARQIVGLQTTEVFPTDYGNVLNSLLLLGKAERLGLHASEDDVTRFIHEFTDHKLSASDFSKILAGNHQRKAGDDLSQAPVVLNDREIYRILARELVLIQCTRVLMPAIIRDTPYETWKVRSLYQTSVQLVGVKVPVSKFIDAAAKPDQAKLEQIYNEGKGRLSDPAKGVIGFMEPTRVEAEYLVADAGKFLDKAVVTDQEIKEYYDTHKAEFVIEEAQTPPVRNLPGPPTSESVPVPAPPKDKPKSVEPTKGKVEAKPTESKSAEKPAEKSAPPAKKDETPKKTSSLAPGVVPAIGALTATTPFLLADEPKTKTAPSDKPAEKPSSDKPAATPADKSSVEKPADKAAVAKPAENPSDKPAAKAAPAVKYKPLDAVKMEIRDQLRRQKAVSLAIAALRKVLNESMAPYLDRYLTERNKYLAEQRRSGGTGVDLTGFKAPEPPSLQKIAEQSGFALKKTGLVTREEAEKIAGLGTAEATGQDASFGSAGQFPNLAFSGQADLLYRASVLQNSEKNEVYLYWITQIQKSHSPKFEEVKSKVIEAWRLKEAEPKAKKEADRLAEEVRKAKGDFAKVFPKGSPFTPFETRFFPRYTRRPNPVTSELFLQPTVLDEIPNAGDAFMEEIFKMKKGEVVALPDSFKQNYYVVEIKERTDWEFGEFVGAYTTEMGIMRSSIMIDRRPERRLQYQAILQMLAREAGMQESAPESQQNPEATDPAQS